MTISWRGLGWLGFMIPLALWGFASAVWGVSNWPAVRAALLIAAAVVWFLGKNLNKELAADGETPHQAFGLPMQWFAVAVLGAFALTFT